MWKILLFSVYCTSLKYSVAEPLIHNLVNRQFESQPASSDVCPQVETLQTILVLLKRLLNKDDQYVLQHEKKIKILQSIKEYLERSDEQVDRIGSQQKLTELLNAAGNAALNRNNAYNQNINRGIENNHIEAKLIIKYDIPKISDVGCKEAIANLIQTIKNAEMQMINDCNRSGKCSLHTESDKHMNERTHILKTIPSFDNLVHIEKQINPSNENPLYIHDLSWYNSLKSDNYLSNKLGSKDLKFQLFPELLNTNQFPFINRINSGIGQTMSRQVENKDSSYHKHIMSKQEQESNVLESDKSNNLKGIFNENYQTHVQMAPKQYPVNIYSQQHPLFIPQFQKEPNVYLHPQLHQEPTLNHNQVLNNPYITGAVKTKFLNRQEDDIDTFNSKNQIEFDTFGKIFHDNTIIPAKEFHNFQSFNNPITLLQSQNIERDLTENYNNEVNNQQLSYDNLFNKYQVIGDKSTSAAKININQNRENVNHGPQDDGISMLIPNSNFNYIQSNPFLSLINRHHRNDLNYNHHQADAFIRNSFGLGPSTISINHPKNEIYDNRLLDLHRFASASNLVELASADNDGIIELTYKVKRPESIMYNSNYYVKYRMPYKDFVSEMINLSNNPRLRSNPLKIHEELLALSNLAEASPDLQNIKSDEVSKLILKNDGILVNATVLGRNGLNVDQYLKTIQNLNANLNTEDFLNLLGKKYNVYASIDSDVPINRPEQYPSDIDSKFQNGDTQYFLDEEPRRLYVPLVQYDTRMVRNPYQPLNVYKKYPTLENNLGTDAE